jgi:hypothetical protein
VGVVRLTSKACLLASLPFIGLVGVAPTTTLAAGTPSAIGVGHGTAEGIDVDFGHSSSGDVDSTSSSNYQVELSFTFSIARTGEVSGGGSGSYTDAHWHLYGVNGQDGPFDCSPPITAAPFSVDVSGHASGGEAHLSVSMPDATEMNADYDCGASYTGFATTSHIMAGSLSLVGGDDLSVSLAAPSSFTVQKRTSSGSGDDTENDQHIWSFSFTPPTTRSGGASGSGPGPSVPSSTCTLSLTNLSAKPSPAPPGRPITVSFDVSDAVYARLLVERASGAKATVAALNLPGGHDALVWGGWFGTLPATGGRYQLTVSAQGCKVTRSGTVSVTIT